MKRVKALIVLGCLALIVIAAFFFLRGDKNSVVVGTETTQQTQASTSVEVVAPPSPSPTSISAPAPTPVTTTPVVIERAPTPTATPVTPPQAAPMLSSQTPGTITIPPQAIVGLQCYYSTTSTYLNINQVQGTPIIFQLSGVIVNPDGYILTAKHGVDPKWVMEAYASTTPGDGVLYNNINFNYCEVSMPTVDSLFTLQQIQQWNPASLLPAPRYKAVIAFDPPQGTMTRSQFDEADFAILKITGLVDNCSKSYKDCAMPSAFPYVPALLSTTPPIGIQLLTYGYPVESNFNYGNGNLYLEGAYGQVLGYDSSTYLNNIPLALRWLAGDILGGRSGSGVFWNGHLTAELYKKVDDPPYSQSITTQAMQEILQQNGWGNIFRSE